MYTNEQLLLRCEESLGTLDYKVLREGDRTRFGSFFWALAVVLVLDTTVLFDKVGDIRGRVVESLEEGEELGWLGVLELHIDPGFRSLAWLLDEFLDILRDLLEVWVVLWASGADPEENF